MKYLGVTKVDNLYVAKLGVKVIGEYKTAEEAADAYNERASKFLQFPILNPTKKYKKDQEVEDVSPVLEKQVSKKEEPVKEVPDEPKEDTEINRLLKELNDLTPQKSEQDDPSEL